MDLGLGRRNALVVGGSKGLGQGVAEALAGEGVSVALLARDPAALKTATKAINGRKQGRAVALVADLADPAAIAAAVAKAQAQLGSIDILINNCGGPPPVTAAGADAALWQAQFQQMVLSTFQLTDLLLPAMRQRGWGRIVNIASTSVVEPIAELAISNGLRGLIAGWSKTLAGEVAGEGVTVNMLLPGSFATARTISINRRQAERDGVAEAVVAQSAAAAIPVGRYGDPAEFGAVAAFLCSKAAAYVTGSMMRVDGGASRSL
ncbi:SDR family oxidoreductase [Dongia mobilis]|uniref:SDR family oxidoreductase n=1 Tax=Dongia sp. TaxID=1977262 RepID=UPI0026F24926